jgi:hypothetical protein
MQLSISFTLARIPRRKYSEPIYRHSSSNSRILISAGSGTEVGQNYTLDKNQSVSSLSDQILSLFHPEISPNKEPEPENQTVNISEFCRYPEGTVLAWGVGDLQRKDEYQGRILGKILGYSERIPGSTSPENVSPVYIPYLSSLLS